MEHKLVHVWKILNKCDSLVDEVDKCFVGLSKSLKDQNEGISKGEQLLNGAREYLLKTRNIAEEAEQIRRTRKKRSLQCFFILSIVAIVGISSLLGVFWPLLDRKA